MHKFLRLIDANLNRSQEGLRVCEDIARFILNDKNITSSFKYLRHRVSSLAARIDAKKFALIKSRNVRKDIGKRTTRREARRSDIRDVFRANAQRVKESLRVLEEVTKLVNKRLSQEFKKVRFRTYDLEKKSGGKLETILHHR